MTSYYLKLLRTFAANGVVHRDEVKNSLSSLNGLVRAGYVEKVPRQGMVFYQLTAKSLPLLESLRKSFLEEARVLAQLSRSRHGYKALVDDLRFLDENSEAARRFRFLGDWQLQRPVVPSQLELARLRYYDRLELS